MSEQERDGAAGSGPVLHPSRSGGGQGPDGSGGTAGAADGSAPPPRWEGYADDILDAVLDP
jgi:hypothetical protein